MAITHENSRVLNQIPLLGGIIDGDTWLWSNLIFALGVRSAVGEIMEVNNKLVSIALQRNRFLVM